MSPSMLAYAQLAGATLLNASSYTVYKAITGMAPRVWWPLFVIGLLLGAANTYLFAQAIRQIPLSMAFPFFSGTSFVAVTLISIVVFRETLYWSTAAGLALVLIGSIVVLQGK